MNRKETEVLEDSVVFRNRLYFCSPSLPVSAYGEDFFCLSTPSQGFLPLPLEEELLIWFFRAWALGRAGFFLPFLLPPPALGVQGVSCPKFHLGVPDKRYFYIVTALLYSSRLVGYCASQRHASARSPLWAEQMLLPCKALFFSTADLGRTLRSLIVAFSWFL